MIRAGIVVTGTEVLTGRISDSNGPWVSERLAEQGVEVAHIVVVADRPDDLEAALRFMAAEKMDLIVQKATELGVTRIVPLFTERSEVKLDPSRAEKRLLHWRAVAASAWRTGSHACSACSCARSNALRMPEASTP